VDGWPIVLYISAGLSLSAGVAIAICGSFYISSPKCSAERVGLPVEMLSHSVAPDNSLSLSSNIASCSSHNHFLGATLGFIPPNDDGSLFAVDGQLSERHRVSRRYSLSHNHFVEDRAIPGYHVDGYAVEDRAIPGYHVDGYAVGDRVVPGLTSSSVVSVV